jgi:hypothetical protein
MSNRLTCAAAVVVLTCAPCALPSVYAQCQAIGGGTNDCNGLYGGKITSSPKWTHMSGTITVSTSGWADFDKDEAGNCVWSYDWWAAEGASKTAWSLQPLNVGNLLGALSTLNRNEGFEDFGGCAVAESFAWPVVDEGCVVL